MSTRERGAWIAAMATVAIAHIGFLIATRRDPVFRVPYLDGAFYHVWAGSLAAGRGDFAEPYFLGPLYPWFVALVYRIAGPDPWAARIAQCGLGIAGAGLVAALARRLGGGLAGFCALGMVTLYGPLVFYENLLLMETLVATLALGALGAVVLPRWNAIGRGALAGVLLGLATLGRATCAAAIPVVWWGLRGREGAWRGGLACAAAWCLVVAPVVARNASRGAVAITTNGGVNFYAGNGRGANGGFHPPPGVRFFAVPAFTSGADPAAALPPAVAARALTVRAIAGTDAAADSRAWWRRAGAEIAADPGRFALLELRKLWLVLQARESSQVESYAFQRERMPALRLFVVTLTWIWPLALWAAWRRRAARDTRIVAGFAAAMLVPCVVFFVTSRYRLAAVPPLAILAGAGAAELLVRLRQRRWRAALAAAAFLVPAGIATRLGARPPRGALGWENAQMAERMYALHDLEAAIAYQERAAAVLPERFEVQLDLALYWSERGTQADLQRAEDTLRALARAHPENALAHFNLGAVLAEEGKRDAAIAAWREALRVEPGFAPARSRILELETVPR